MEDVLVGKVIFFPHLILKPLLQFCAFPSALHATKILIGSQTKLKLC